jgi:hypothetical protein
MTNKDLTPAELEAVAKLLEAVRNGWSNTAYAYARDPLVESARKKMAASVEVKS